jgi:hypothetical protein
MNAEHLIRFEAIDWETPKEGVKQKVYTDGNNRMRLLQFHDNFVEEDWCLNGHAGYVLNGEMQIDFNGTIRNYRQGNGLWINHGEESKHKVLIEKGKFVELILFESEK